MHTPSLVLTTIVALALAACGQSADPVPGAASTPVTAASGAAPSATPSSSMADAASPGQSAPGPATPSTTAVAGAYLDDLDGAHCASTTTRSASRGRSQSINSWCAGWSR